MKKLIFTLIAFAQVVITNQLSAQSIINNDTTHRNRAYLRTAIDPATMIGFGFQRNVKPKIITQYITLYTELNISAFKFNLENAELKIGGIAPLLQKRSFKIVNDLNLSAGSLSARHFNSKKFAFADEIAFGLYKHGWFIAITAEYEKIYMNYLEHTDFYRQTYYEDAVNGWYKGAGGMFQFGFEGGITIMKRIDIHLELKVPFTEKFNGYGGSPLHVNLGYGFRF